MKTAAHHPGGPARRAAWLAAAACCAALAAGGCAVAPRGRPHHGAAAKPAACTSAALKIGGGREGENSAGVHGDILFTNTGTRPCELRRVPAVAIVTAAGTRLAVRLVRRPAPTVRPVLLRPGTSGSADLVVFWSNWCGARPGQLSVQVTLPGGGTVSGPFDGPPDYDAVPPCLSAGRPSRIAVLDAYQR